MASDEHWAYCAEQVRRLDNDRFLTALFAPSPGARRDLLALYAFNLEIARVREAVSEPLLGEMRLQWWRDALDGVYAGSPPEHAAVALALADAVARHELDRAAFDRLIDGRAADLAALEAYADDTSAALVALALAILVEGSAAPRDAGRPAGSASPGR